ncbi:FAD-dependent oxidoreductase [Phytohabitans sp. ZYX-F-186]|uniref:FAD-dependent oxidoreductase n=1 Tax=Phytohabitans maris TaxID=3071409 RepID=A0ABU0ZL01_9ACTN|nr:FAD-dependent oxidoreductase [Phytohabitans sp. ZYX-F-186]MDQ7907726.1 FAD-dependent oxidoreductase [Phytohabitans sp. ZYX-F-186]
MATSLKADSLWMSTVDDDLARRPALGGSLVADVAIVGAGYTGLWTAYYLASAAPSLRVVVLEKEFAGYGASGRNGGWCSALFPTPMSRIERQHGSAAAAALRRTMNSTVDEVGRVAAAEGIDCHWSKGGTVALARTPAQLRRARAAVAEDEDLVLLSAEEAAKRCGATGVLGGAYTPHCAAIHPARLVRGLARAVERRGVTIYEGTPVVGLRKGAADTPVGTVRAPVVVRATEAYTPRLPGTRRAIAPVYSLMISTPPLPDDFWAAAGLAERETFTDFRRLIIYGQRTADGRLAFGGRGAPYHFGSKTDAAYDSEPRVFAALYKALVELFPALAGVPITHSWGGAVGVASDWAASVGLDRETGLAWAGGYVGDGVGTTNLAGRTLADLILGVESELTSLPWVGHQSPQWPPEPLRWMGINTVRKIVTWADAARL